ncbi:MAG: hypothetical protein GY945_13565 [Rhodobacteraceae bacterium]|nr:hypothetical protein [Paracoccaceae bacterium]
MKTPWQLWLTGILALLWNAGGAYDHILTKTENADYLSSLSPEHLAYLDAVPAWAGALWALGVWAGVAGAILLLLRSRFAGTAFAISLVGMVGNLAYGLGLSEVSMLDIAGPFAMTFSVAILLIAIGLWLYARRMTRAGVLR